MPSPRTAFDSIPVIDISGLYSSRLEERQAVAAELEYVASNIGFLYIKGHHIPAPLIDNLLATTRAFFAQPLETRMQSYIGNSENHSGYVPEGEEQFYSGSKDHKESCDLGFDMRDPARQRPMLGPNLWPQMPGFREHVGAYYQEALELGRVLFRGFALALGLEEDYFADKTLTPPSQLRLIHYPFDASATDGAGIGAHTDYECFTLLLPTADGLEVLNGAGEWIDAPVIPDTFVVNIGDMLEVLSNGRFLATSHRVRRVQEERYSFPLFCSCDYDTVIEPVLPPLPGAATDKYASLRCGDHLYAQTIHTFAYMKKRLAEGRISLPETAHEIASFGRIKAAAGERA